MTSSRRMLVRCSDSGGVHVMPTNGGEAPNEEEMKRKEQKNWKKKREEKRSRTLVIPCKMRSGM